MKSAPTIAARRPQPFLFVHIPKTAGTSFLTTLGNSFGEEHVRRLVDADLDETAIRALLASPEMAGIRCLAGHFPLSSFGERLRNFRVFTILRDPVERVMSLYRFMRAFPADKLAPLGLRDGFDFDDFLASRAPELFAQVRNGMCRVLSNAPALSDPASPLFWHERLPEAALDRAVSMLWSIGFGLAEEMRDTLAMVAAMLERPYDLSEHFENFSPPPGPERTARNIHRIIELNTADIALYHQATSLFRTRMERLRVATGGAEGRVEVIRLTPQTEARICDIPGRRGFHAYEIDLGFSWLLGSQPAQVAFAATPGPTRLSLSVYRLVDAYPVEEIALTMNGNAVPHRWTRSDEGWGVIETEPFSAEGFNLLTLTVPYTIPARFLTASSPDRRQLSIAVASITLTTT